MMRNLQEAVWSYQSQQIKQPPHVPVESANNRLASELLDVCGHYLNCILPRYGKEILFNFAVRHEEPAFLKLDLQIDPVSAEPIVGGVDLTRYPASSFLTMAEKYYQAANIDYYVPAALFGVQGAYGFYVESPYAFQQISPFFIHASHAFIALLLATYFAGDRTGLFNYVDQITRDQDPLQLIEREPLMRFLLSDLPAESRNSFYRQLGGELKRILLAQEI